MHEKAYYNTKAASRLWVGVGVVDIYYLITVPSIDTKYVRSTYQYEHVFTTPRLDLILSSLYRPGGSFTPPIHAPPKHTRTGWPLKAIIRYLKGTADQGLMSRQPEIFYSIYIYNIYVDARLCVTISRQITIIIYPTESLRRKEIFQNRIAALEVRLGTPLVLSKPPDRRGGSTPQ